MIFPTSSETKISQTRHAILSNAKKYGTLRLYTADARGGGRRTRGARRRTLGVAETILWTLSRPHGGSIEITRGSHCIELQTRVADGRERMMYRHYYAFLKNGFIQTTILPKKFALRPSQSPALPALICCNSAINVAHFKLAMYRPCSSPRWKSNGASRRSGETNTREFTNICVLYLPLIPPKNCHAIVIFLKKRSISRPNDEIHVFRDHSRFLPRHGVEARGLKPRFR